MSTVANWYLNQLASHGFIVVVAVQGAAILAFCLGLAALLDWHTDRQNLRDGIRAAERHANHPANRQRKEKP